LDSRSVQSAAVVGQSPSLVPAADVRMFDIRGAVAYLKQIGCDAATVNFVRSLISTGQVPHLHIGKKFYVTRVALDQWLAKSERRAR
jgi:hypothetical protein